MILDQAIRTDFSKVWSVSSPILTLHYTPDASFTSPDSGFLKSLMPPFAGIGNVLRSNPINMHCTFDYLEALGEAFRMLPLSEPGLGFVWKHVRPLSTGHISRIYYTNSIYFSWFKRAFRRNRLLKNILPNLSWTIHWCRDSTASIPYRRIHILYLCSRTTSPHFSGIYTVTKSLKIYNANTYLQYIWLCPWSSPQFNYGYLRTGMIRREEQQRPQKLVYIIYSLLLDGNCLNVWVNLEERCM